MANSNTLEIIVALKDQIGGGLKNVESGLKGLESAASTVSSKIFNLQNAIASLGAGLLAKAFVEANSTFEDFGVSLETATGSAQGAADALAYVEEKAAKMPYTLAEVNQGFATLANFGLDARKDLTILGDTAAGIGKPLQQAVEAMTDAVTGEFERLKEFGIRSQTVGDQVTFSWLQNGKQMEKTVKKTGDAIETGLLDILENRFGGSMERFSSTWTGMWTNLQDAATSFLKGIGDAGSFDYLKDQLAGLLSKIQEFKKSGELGVWAGRISSAIQGAIENIKRMAAVVLEAAKPFEPWLKRLVEISPTLIAVVAGIAGVTGSLNLMLPAVNGTIAAFKILNKTIVSTQFKLLVTTIQNTSAQMGVLTAATVSFQTALATATLGVGAFFAGWQIGKLISASDAFGMFPRTIGSYVQEGFGMLDAFVTRIRIKFLEVQKTWNDITGDRAESAAIQKAIASEQAYLDQIQLTIDGIREKGTAEEESTAKKAAAIQAAAAAEAAAQAARIAQTQSAEDQITAIQKQAADSYISGMKDANAEAKTMLDQRVVDIQAAEEKGLITHQAAAAQKIQAEVEFYQGLVDAANAGMLDVAATYGEDTKKFKEAVAAKTDAEKQYSEYRVKIEKESQEQIKALYDAELGLRKAQLDKKLADIKAYEEQGVMTHKNAAVQKQQAELDFLRFRMENTRKAIDDAIAQYGRDSAEYKKAAAEKIRIEMEMAEVVKKTTEAMKETTAAVKETAVTAGAAAAAIDQMAEAADRTHKATKGTNRTLLSTSKAMSMSMAEMERAGLSSAASMLNIDDAYKDLRSQVKKLGGDTSLLWRTSINDIKAYVSELMKASAQKMNVDFTGTGSSERPLGDKLAEMGEKIKAFATTIPDASMNTAFEGVATGIQNTLKGALDAVALPAMTGPAQTRGAAGTIGGVKNLGSVDIQLGGKAYPVMGRTNVIGQLKDQLRRERRVTAL